MMNVGDHYLHHYAKSSESQLAVSTAAYQATTHKPTHPDETESGRLRWHLDLRLQIVLTAQLEVRRMGRLPPILLRATHERWPYMNCFHDLACKSRFLILCLAAPFLSRKTD